jgi:carbon storage regulator CsrA
MLVLTRRPKEKVLFPDLNTTVQVLDIKSGAVRLGIQAPAEVVVFREELWKGNAAAPVAQSQDGKQGDLPLLDKLKNLVRNRLNVANIGLAVLRQQVKAGLLEEAEGTLEEMEHDFQLLQERVEGEQPRACRSAGQGPRALIVEDDQNECELMAGFLRMAGLQVATAADGADALEYLRREARPDFVLLDMLMPRCDGLTTARAIRRDPRLAEVKIFALTGLSPEEFDGDLNSAGINRWFQKPINPQVLLQHVQRELCRPN